MVTHSGSRAVPAHVDSGRGGGQIADPAPPVVARRRAGPWAVVEVVGELDLSTVPLLSAACEGSRCLVIDLHGVTFMDCSSLRVLLDARHRAATDGGAVRLVAPTWEVSRVLALADLEQSFPVFATVTEAISQPPAGAGDPVPRPRPGGTSSRAPRAAGPE